MLPQPHNAIIATAFERLVSMGVLHRDLFDAALKESLRSDKDLETILLDKYRVPKTQLGQALGKFFDCPYVPFDDRTILDLELIKSLSFDYLRKNHWVPLRRQGSVLDVLIDDPHHLEKGLDIRRAFPGVTVRFSVGLRREIEQFLVAAMGQTESASISDILGELVHESQDDGSTDAGPGTVDENDSAIVRLAHQIIAEAYRVGASDVHIEPYSDRKETAIRFRVDGTCFTYMRIPPAYRRAIVSRIKIMANLDIAERRRPQDGKIRFRLAKDREIELRVATIPTAGANEDVAMRVLTAKETMPLEALDLTPRSLGLLRELGERPHGLILCVGPTGSGKTTTLHAMLGHINTEERKIWTAEDPVEITQDGLRQVQINPKIGFTFAAALRSFLRADPDVIMIGEIRDRETADVAIEASLTGHLVLSTLHTNSAAETVTRLLDMGCDSFNFADAILGVLAQRLAKRICGRCKEAYHPPRDEYDELVRAYGANAWASLGLDYGDGFRLYRGRGCEGCNGTGFRGRIGLHELMLNSADMRDLIQSRARTRELLNLALSEGMTTLLQDGSEKALRGLTTLRCVRSVALK